MVVVDCWPFTSDDRTRQCLQIPDYYRKFRYDTHTSIVNIYKVLSYRICIYDNFPDLRENLRYYNFYDTYYRLLVLGTTLQPQGKESGQRDTTKNRGRLGGIRQTPGYLQKQSCHLPEETGVQLLCAASYDIIWCRDLDTDQTSTEQTCGRTDQNGTKYAQHHIQRYKDQHLGQGEDKTHRYNLHCEKNEMVLGRAYQPPQRRPMDLARRYLETIWQEMTTRETSQAVER